MEPEKAVAFIAVCWLIVAVLSMMRSVRRGRNLAEALATRHPAMYETLGRPRPGYFASVRRTRFAQFVGRREFAILADEWLAAQFEAHRKLEIWLVLTIIGSGAVIALLAFCVRHAA